MVGNYISYPQPLVSFLCKMFSILRTIILGKDTHKILSISFHLFIFYFRLGPAKGDSLNWLIILMFLVWKDEKKFDPLLIFPLFSTMFKIFPLIRKFSHTSWKRSRAFHQSFAINQACLLQTIKRHVSLTTSSFSSQKMFDLWWGSPLENIPTFSPPPHKRHHLSIYVFYSNPNKYWTFSLSSHYHREQLQSNPSLIEVEFPDDSLRVPHDPQFPAFQRILSEWRWNGCECIIYCVDIMILKGKVVRIFLHLALYPHVGKIKNLPYWMCRPKWHLKAELRNFYSKTHHFTVIAFILSALDQFR